MLRLWHILFGHTTGDLEVFGCILWCSCGKTWNIGPRRDSRGRFTR